MKKFVGLALLGLVAFNSCDSELNVNEKSEAVAEARTVFVHDEDIDFEKEGWEGTFVFKNGAKVSGYVDTYENKDGKVTIGIYFTVHLNAWKKQLDKVGITYTVDKTSNPFLRSHISFASDLVRSRK